jgi:allantoinase
VDVTCETCPHYLELTEEDLVRLGAPAKCAPPLRHASVRDELWHRVENGHVDFIASDHSPSPPSMKQDANFFKVWGGIAGVQSTLSILLSRRPALSLEIVARMTSRNVTERFHVNGKGAFEAGYDADVALVDVGACYTLTRERLLDSHKLSPYVGRTFHGLVRRTIVRGTTVFLDGKIVSKPIGRLVKPA